MAAAALGSAMLACVTSLCAALPLPALAAATASQPAGSIYSCKDDSGRVITSDQPIADCSRRDLRQLNWDGSLRQVIRAPLTRAEREQAQRREAEEREAERAMRQQKARDRNLLLQFEDEDALDLRRERTLATIDDEVTATRGRVRLLGAELDAARRAVRRWPYENPANPSPPFALKQRVTEVTNAIVAEDSRIRERLEERDRVDARFAADRKRLRELLGHAVPTTEASRSGAPDTQANVSTARNH